MGKYSPIKASAGWVQGEDKRFDFYCTDADGSPVNLTGATLLFKLWSADKQTLYFTKSGGSITLADGNGTNDVARVQTADTDTISTAPAVLVPHGIHYYELWKVNEGDEQRLAWGEAELLESPRRQETS
jgi:hypothetical protein